MRTEPIDPVELRRWLLKRAELWRQSAQSFPRRSGLHKAQLIGAEALEVVRHEFLRDMSPLDDTDGQTQSEE